MRMVAVLLLAASSAHAASFDCSKAATVVEMAICSSPRLNALDDELAIAYRDARKEGRPTQAAQSSWLRERRNVCGISEECLEQAYLLRIAQLRAGALFAQEKPPASIFGRYSEVIENCFADSESPDGTRCEGTVENIITVKRARGNAVAVSMQLVFFNGHLCEFESTGEWSGGELRLPQFEESLEHDCVLVARFDDGNITISDPMGVCRHTFCGARGGFDDYSLEKAKGRK